MKSSVILLLLDLSAAFDTIDNDILLSRRQKYFGHVILNDDKNGNAGDWFKISQYSKISDLNVGSKVIKLGEHVRNSGVIIDV